MAKSLACVASTLLMLTLLATPKSRAEIQSTSGAVVEIEPPPSVVAGALESDTTIWAFNEVQYLSLPMDIGVDISTPGYYDSEGDLTPTIIPAGADVCSHFLHADRVGNTPYVRVSGSVTVSSDIIGVIVIKRQLDMSDGVCGAPGTVYPTGAYGRGLELSTSEDQVTFEPDMRTITVSFRHGEVVDQLRILTVIPPSEAEKTSWGEAKARYWQRDR